MPSYIVDMLCRAHPNAEVRSLLELFQLQTGRDLRAEWRERYAGKGGNGGSLTGCYPGR